MDQVSEFLQKLFESSDWPARWNCGKWSDFHGWLHIGSDVAIWLAYFIIPVVIIWYIQNKRDIAFLPVFWLFSAFIIFCGTTHIIDAIIFWRPVYRLSALFRFITAVVSFFTVFALIRDLPKLLGRKKENEKTTSGDFHTLELERKLEEKNAQIENLKNQLEALKP